MLLRSRANAGRARPADVVAVALSALALACHPGLGPAPWSAIKGSVPAIHAQVRTLNDGYSRTRSTALVREIDEPTRANLDYAAYHANFMIADPEPAGARVAGGVAVATAPFHGLVEAATLTGDIGRTPLTADERAHPLAFAPVVEYLSAHKVAGA
ncbi:MAG TPA: hypothetical protein VG319_14910, partial [Polyangia bacterium]|nr:hypothetical protein [Polyangia bacterium]